MALPAHVATDELIESAWGNNVVDSLTAIGRLRRFLATRVTSQTMTGGAYTTIVFTTIGQNTIPLAAGPPISIPSGAAGPYSITARAVLSASNTNQVMRLTIGATFHDAPMAAVGRGTMTWTGYLDPAQTITFSVFVPTTVTCDVAQIEILGQVPVIT